jgi:hypothetical protein
MKILLLKDKQITSAKLKRVQKQLEAMYADHAIIKLEWAIEEMDYTEYPVEEYSPGDFGIKRAWIRDKCAEVHKRWREEIDHVVFMVHSDNWELPGVWGWNLSKVYSGYGVQQVRFADVPTHTIERNTNNSVGTLYHELMHDHDAFVYTYLGINIEPLVKVDDWDHNLVHGNSEKWKYIRFNENLDGLATISPLLRQAITKRREIFTHYTGLQKQVIALLQQKAVLLRQLIAEQRGDIAILEDNVCK